MYKETIPFADTMYLSFINKEYDGDTYFPEFNEKEWVVERTEVHSDTS